MDQLHTRLDVLEQQMHTVNRRLRWWRATALLLLGLGLVGLPWQMAHTQGRTDVTARAQTLEQRVAALEAKLKYLTTRLDSSGRPLMEVAGANLRVVNGAGKTDTANGLGNVIVGYNELRGDEAFVENTRTGSHNVVVGRQHNYASFGGLVVGELNSILGAFASVSGGSFNRAAGPSAVVSGGFDNTASGSSAVVSGGTENTASGSSAVVSGGRENTASGDFAVVSGGQNNMAESFSAAVSGGVGNTASGFRAAVSGGIGNTASGHYASVSGGQNRTAAGDFDWVAGSLLEDD